MRYWNNKIHQIDQFLNVDQCEEYSNACFDFLETVSPRFFRDKTHTWHIQDHHTLKGIKLDPISHTQTRGSGWILACLREVVAKHILKHKNQFENKEDDLHEINLLCSIEGFTIIRPDDEVNIKLNDHENRQMNRHGIRTVMALTPMPTSHALVVREQKLESEIEGENDKFRMQQGSLFVFQEKGIQCILRTKPKCELTTNKNTASLGILFYCTFYIDKNTGNDNQVKDINTHLRKQQDAYYFANTFSQFGDLKLEDNDARISCDHKAYEPKNENTSKKVRMVKAYQHMKGHIPLSLYQCQLHGLIPYCKHPGDDNENFKQLERRFYKLGIYFINEMPAIHPQLELLKYNQNESLSGQDKYLGGVGSACGKFVYGIPGNATQVLRITVATGNVDMIGPHFQGKFKW